MLMTLMTTLIVIEIGMIPREGKLTSWTTYSVPEQKKVNDNVDN